MFNSIVQDPWQNNQWGQGAGGGGPQPALPPPQDPGGGGPNDPWNPNPGQYAPATTGGEFPVPPPGGQGPGGGQVPNGPGPKAYPSQGDFPHPYDPWNPTQQGPNAYAPQAKDPFGPYGGGGLPQAYPNVNNGPAQGAGKYQRGGSWTDVANSPFFGGGKP